MTPSGNRKCVSISWTGPLFKVSLNIEKLSRQIISCSTSGWTVPNEHTDLDVR
jgi:hypothetical protein